MSPFRSAAIAAVLALLLTGPASAQTRHGDPPAGTTGLLTVPEIAGGELGYCGDFAAVPLPLHDTPESGANGAYLQSSGAASCPGELSSVHHADGRQAELPLMEHGYEAASLIVLEARPPWYRIALADGSAWVKAGHGHYRDLVELYADGLTYLTAAWTGELCDGPDGDRVCAMADIQRLHDEHQDSVEVLDWARMPDGLWLEVQLTTSPCHTDLQRTLPIRGWLRAQGDGQAPNVWFYSRGC